MTRDEIRPFALGEPCAQNKEGELLWSFDAIAHAIEEARAAEREACAQVCQERAEKFEGAARRADARREHDDAATCRATAWQIGICANRIRARWQQ
mgnify:CR=1 FL=1